MCKRKHWKKNKKKKKTKKKVTIIFTYTFIQARTSNEKDETFQIKSTQSPINLSHQPQHWVAKSKKKRKRKSQKPANPTNEALKIPQHCYFDTEIVRIPAMWLTNFNHNVETQRNTPI
jgi:hypothetical protein